MKLIDILVRELPERGGWPDGSNACRQFPDGEICFNHVSREPDFYAELSDDVDLVLRATKSPHVTKEQYEAALAASKQEWNGEGLPPVGTEVEVSVDGGRTWCSYKASSERNGMRIVEIGNFTEEFQSNNWMFRPIRSEADKKRAEAIEALVYVYRNALGDVTGAFGCVYDAIASGKITGVKLED